MLKRNNMADGKIRASCRDEIAIMGRRVSLSGLT